MPTMDQVVWQSVNLATGEGEATQYKRGDLLPFTEDQAQLAQRSLLRLGGAIRVVEVVYTDEELAEQARARGEATSRAAVAHDVDPAAAMGAQVPGDADPGPPTLTSSHGAPVVIGDEGMKADHEEQAAEAAARAVAAKPPQPSAAKHTWVDFAVEQRGADRDQAEALTRDQLAAKYGRG
jgi:hypothetical protein